MNSPEKDALRSKVTEILRSSQKLASIVLTGADLRGLDFTGAISEWL